jgi:AP-4 complex subunit mu-1
MISQLFILAPNGHTIVHKDYRGEVPKEASETFLRMMVEQASGSPVFIVDGVTYICVRKNGIFFLATSVFNVSPSFVIELLTQLTKVRPRPLVRVRPGAGEGEGEGYGKCRCW